MKDAVGFNSTTAYWLVGLFLAIIGVFVTLIVGYIGTIIGFAGIACMIISVVRNAKAQAATGLKVMLIGGKIIWIVILTLMNLFITYAYIVEQSHF